MTTVRDNQATELGLLQQILATLQAQPNPVPTLAVISQQLDAINTGVGLLLASLQRVEQFIAPLGAMPPSDVQAGMAYDLARLAHAVAGSPGRQPDYVGLDAFLALVEVIAPATSQTAAAAGRIRDALWPVGVAAPVDTLGGPNNMFYYLYRLAHATTAPYNDPTPRQPIQVALGGLLDAAGEINEDTTWLVGAVGGRVNNLSAIDWLAQIASCSCGEELPPPSPGGCIQPEVSSGATETGGRLYATWAGTGQIFFLGAVTFEPAPTVYPDRAGLVSSIWPELSIYVQSTAPYWSIGGGEVSLTYPVNQWLQVPLGAGDTLAVSVAAGHSATAYLCAAAAQPPDPEPGFVALSSTGGTVLTPEGVPDPDTPYGWAINDWARIGETSRVRNPESGYTHQMSPGSYVDLTAYYEVYSDQDWSLFQGAGGFVRDVLAGVHTYLAPGTNYSCARAAGAFVLYVREIPPP